jgi:hypothetical protein
MQKKRKDTSPCGDNPPAKKQELCIVHVPGIKPGSFIAFADLDNPAERLATIHNVRDRRMAEPPQSSKRMADVCQHIPEDVDMTQGYHRVCYQRFTMNLDRLTATCPTEAASTSHKRPKRQQVLKQIIFDPDCIFCNVAERIHVREGSSRTTQGTNNFERDGWQRVVDLAEQRQDEHLLLRIRGYDLFSCEAKYHPKCRKHYTMDPQYWRSRDAQNVATQSPLEAAHDMAFRHIAEYVDQTVVIGGKVEQLSSLRLMYIAKLDETQFANANYRADKLKNRMIKHPVLGPKLDFIKVKPENSTPFYLIFSVRISVGEAVAQAYQLASKDSIKDVALLLRGTILRAFEESNDLRWPPSTCDLEVKDGVIPPALYRFLSLVISGQPTTASDRAERLVFSIGQDMCRATTNGEWKLPKHILLCMTLRHLFRSKQLLTLLNRLGHCENYSFGMDWSWRLLLQ